jgi:hypothetical protein
MNVMAIALVVVMAGFVCVAMGVVSWGLVLEARSNRDWRERALGE